MSICHKEITNTHNSTTIRRMRVQRQPGERYEGQNKIEYKGKNAHSEGIPPESSRMAQDQYRLQRTFQSICLDKVKAGSSNWTYATNVRMVTLATVTAPVSRPYPTPTSDKNAPVVDSPRRVLRPKRWISLRLTMCGLRRQRTHLNEENGREGHHNIDHRDTERHEWPSVRKCLRQDVIAVIQN